MLIRSGSVRGELERMQKEMDRIWNRFSKELSTSTFQQDWNPSLDLMETEDSLVAEIEIPGVDPNGINISVTPDTLTFAGEKNQEVKGKGESYHVRERTYGKFSRSIRLPTMVNPDQVEARYKNGILRITMGKNETAESKRIEVKTA